MNSPVIAGALLAAGIGLATTASSASPAVKWAAVNLTETVVIARTLVSGPVVFVHDDNRIVIRYGVVQATMVIVEDVQLGDGGPRLQLMLTSVLVALALRAVVRTPAIFISGRAITVDLAALDRTGRLQIPKEFLERLDVKERARLRLEADHVEVLPEGAEAGRDGVEPGT